MVLVVKRVPVVEHPAKRAKAEAEVVAARAHPVPVALEVGGPVAQDQGGMEE